jgi:hypothetical protein
VSQYRTYGKVQIEGTQDYVAGVTGCLDVIDSIPDGRNNENIEELITTGMPPYDFEELSDNKMRTQWPSHLHFRQDY